MAGYRQHLGVSTALGVAYGAAGATSGHMDWGLAVLGGGLTALGGLLPDLDSDSGVPVRELFSLASTAVFVLLIPRMQQSGLTVDQMLVVLAGIYLFVRYVLPAYFKSATVHRGMFHSIPAMGIAGLTVFLLYSNGDALGRAFLAGGVMLGFLSHLVLDEIWAVNLRGVRLKFNRFSGTAVKLAGPSLAANAFTYTVLGLLAAVAWLSF